MWDFWPPPQCCVHFPRKPEHTQTETWSALLGVGGGLLPTESLLVSDVSSLWPLCCRPSTSAPSACQLAALPALSGCQRGHGTATRLRGTIYSGAAERSRAENDQRHHLLRPRVSVRSPLKAAALRGNICFPHQQIAASRLHSELFGSLIMSCV